MVPRIFQETFAARLGIKSAGGFVPFTLGTSAPTDKISVITGSVNTATFPSLYFLGNSTSVLWAPTQKGTIVEFTYTHQSINNFTYQIDGGAAVPVPTNGSATWAKITVTGLPYGQHTLRINNPGVSSVYVYLGGGKISNADGIAVDNICQGGSRAASGTTAQNWTDLTVAPGPYINRKQMWETLGVTPDLVVAALGANDILNGDTAANAVNGLNTIRGWYPNSDFMLLHTGAFSGATIPVFDQYSALKYALADTLDVPMFDFRYKMGDSDEANSFGILGADNAHANDALANELARVMAGGLSAPFGGISDTPAASAVDGGGEAVSAALGTAGAVTLDCSSASVYTLSPTANVTSLLLTNPPPTGTSCFITLIVSQGATPRTIATPSGGVFLGLATPTQVANKVGYFTYHTVNGGATWYCNGVVQV